MPRSFASLFVLSSLAGCRAPSPAQADPAAVIEYRGELVRLTKRYDDFDIYKDDPNNIAPAEYQRVRKLVETAPIPEHCADWHEVFRVQGSLQFPGYGSGHPSPLRRSILFASSPRLSKFRTPMRPDRYLRKG